MSKDSERRQKMADNGSKLIKGRSKPKGFSNRWYKTRSDAKILQIAGELIQAYNRRKNYGDFVPAASNDVVSKLNSLAYACRGHITRITDEWP